MRLGSAMCDHCGNIIEDAIHALRGCPLVLPLWLELVEESARHNFFVGDLYYWR
jgi:hypothetical protein